MAKQQYPNLDPYHPVGEVYYSFIEFSLTLYTPSTVKTRLKRINTAGKEISGKLVSEQLSKLWINRTFAAAAKRLAPRAGQKRLPLTPDILAKTKQFVDFTKHDDRALWAILCVGVFTLARIGELAPAASSELKVPLRAASIRGDKGVLSLVGTKTDRERKGVELLFFRNDSPCCPVTAMSTYLSARPSSSRDTPLFINNKKERITQNWVVPRLRALLDKAGFQGKDFSGISLRRGGAQTLLRLRANDTMIMGMGRWTSSCFNRYLKVEETEIMKWQQSMAATAR